MEVVHERCCGLNVHKKNVVACVITPAGRQVRSFGTMTRDLLQMLGWLQGQAVTQVAMESTRVYWKPLFNLIETTELATCAVSPYSVTSSGCPVVLVEASHRDDLVAPLDRSAPGPPGSARRVAIAQALGVGGRSGIAR